LLDLSKKSTSTFFKKRKTLTSSEILNNLNKTRVKEAACRIAVNNEVDIDLSHINNIIYDNDRYSDNDIYNGIDNDIDKDNDDSDRENIKIITSSISTNPYDKSLSPPSNSNKLFEM
jgi:hypothetical protein